MYLTVLTALSAPGGAVVYLTALLGARWRCCVFNCVTFITNVKFSQRTHLSMYLQKIKLIKYILEV